MIIFSIVTVVKNNIDGLKLTYESIKKQTISQDNFEWLVKDSESNDGTIEFLKQIENNETIKNFKWKSNFDSGIYDGMNQAIDMAEGLYINFQNGGDILADSNVLSILKERLNSINPNEYPTFIYGNDIIQNLNGKMVHRKARDIKYLWHSLPCSHQAIFYNLAAINAIRYNLDYKICGDYYFTYKIYLTKYTSHIVIDCPITIMQAGYHAINHKRELLEEALKVKNDLKSPFFIFRHISYIIGYLNNTLLHKYPRAYRNIRNLMNNFINKPKY